MKDGIENRSAVEERHTLGSEIKEKLEDMRRREGWTIDDLAGYLEINNLTLRNSLHRAYWSDLVVTVLKLKHAIPADLCYEYKRALEREKIENRKKGINKEAS